ncbi:MAG: vitamin B12-dependent ribonucleotide reductase [Candidatus Omnitrophota bacterium]
MEKRINNIELSENAIKVLEKRYLKKDEHGNIIETPQDMFMRVAGAIAQADKIYKKSDAQIEKTKKQFYEIMANLEFMPNSPTLMNAGRELGQLSACFVLPVSDSMESIFEAVKNTALIHRSGGGTGFSFSRLRPRNSRVKTTDGVASGPVSFMKVFDSATHAVKQGGRRRGANMGILRIDHPDILEFITCKENDKDITNFNISVGISEDFIKKAENNEKYDLIAPHTKEAVGQLSAKEVFDLIVKMAHRNGEPGLIFLDRLNKDNPTPKLGEIESTNPCGEQPILPYESCNLGSINLSRMLKDDSGTAALDWEKLRETTRIAVHFLDNVIDVNKFPIPEIEKATKQTRKVGLGVMGWADMLIKLGVAYNSQEAVNLAEKVISVILKEARQKSHEIALERGAFPAFEGSVYDNQEGIKLRNATLTTIAPTGTISIIAECSSGIEPLFAVSYYREVLDKEKLIEVNKEFYAIANERDFYSEALSKKIAEKGTIKEIDDIPKDIRDIFVTAHDIEPEWHVKMQAAFQCYTDNAVSKTINFPHAATLNDVQEAYILAYKLGCKGITIYRDRSREAQVLNIASPKKEITPISRKISPRPRPLVTTGTTTKINTGCGNLYVTVNVDDNGMPFEIFTQMGKSGGCAASQLEAVARLVSLALRCGIEVRPLIDQLAGIRCPTPAWEKGGRVFSCADAIAKVIERRIGDKLLKEKERPQAAAGADLIEISASGGKDEDTETTDVVTVVGVCPDCGAALQHEEGCVKCNSCGYSKC